MKKNRKTKVSNFLAIVSRLSLLALVLPQIACSDSGVGGPIMMDEYGRAIIKSYEDCVTAGYVILRTYPSRCVTPDNKVFVKKVEKKKVDGGVCRDLCGNGTCEQIVCLAQGCPCAETPVTCPSDCVSTFYQ